MDNTYFLISMASFGRHGEPTIVHSCRAPRMFVAHEGLKMFKRFTRLKYAQSRHFQRPRSKSIPKSRLDVRTQRPPGKFPFTPTTTVFTLSDGQAAKDPVLGGRPSGFRQTTTRRATLTAKRTATQRANRTARGTARRTATRTVKRTARRPV